MKTKALRLALLATISLGLAAPSASFANRTVVKATANKEWNPSYQHIAPGTRVVWVNPERHARTHEFGAYGRGWSKAVVLEPGERTAKRFNDTGTYKYRCRLHSQLSDGQCQGMCGVIHVMR